MRDENLRVCSSPLGSVSNLDAAFISVSFLSWTKHGFLYLGGERQSVSKLTYQITHKKLYRSQPDKKKNYN